MKIDQSSILVRIEHILRHRLDEVHLHLLALPPQPARAAAAHQEHLGRALPQPVLEHDEHEGHGGPQVDVEEVGVEEDLAHGRLRVPPGPPGHQGDDRAVGHGAVGGEVGVEEGAGAVAELKKVQWSMNNCS